MSREESIKHNKLLAKAAIDNMLDPEYCDVADVTWPDLKYMRLAHNLSILGYSNLLQKGCAWNL